ncbi:hypothetical protein [Dyella sp. 20L07]|uniref:hypothetical protein n=1 Tax=Dyella sp. 20L07 TaxID=3384240 RepID=UPI003D29DCF6
MKKGSKIAIGLAACAVVACGVTAAAAITSHAASWTHGVTYWSSYYRGQQTVRDTLLDPDSANFRGLYWHKTVHGNAMCGMVNARNGMGGYIGFRPFFKLGPVVEIADPDDTHSLQRIQARCFS